MSQYVEGPEAAQVVENRSQLIDYFYQAGKRARPGRIGLNTKWSASLDAAVEQPVILANAALNVSSSPCRRSRMEPLEEEGHVNRAKGERANISLEPGAQLELSGEQCETIHCANHESASPFQASAPSRRCV